MVIPSLCRQDGWGDRDACLKSDWGRFLEDKEKIYFQLGISAEPFRYNKWDIFRNDHFLFKAIFSGSMEYTLWKVIKTCCQGLNVKPGSASSPSHYIC